MPHEPNIEKPVHEKTEKNHEVLDKDFAESGERGTKLLYLAKALDSSSDAILIAGSPENCIYLNNTFVSLTGYNVEQLNQAGGFSVLYEIPEFCSRVFELVKKGRSWSGEVEMRSREGRLIPVEVRADGIRDDSGRFIGLIGVIRDVTLRKQSEKALKESERILSTLMGNLPGMAYRCQNDRRWTMKFVSQGCLELTGYEPSELIENRTCAYNDLIHPNDRDNVWEKIQEAIAKKRAFRLIYRMITRSAKEKWVWEQGVGVFSDDGELLGIEGFITDVSELKQTEKALIKSEASLRSIIKAAPAGIGLVHNRVLSWVSPELTNMLGYSKEEMIGRSARMLYATDEEFERVGRVKYRNIAVRGTGEIDTRWKHKDGRIMDIHLRSTPIDPRDYKKGVTFTAQDITDRISAAEALRESEEKYRLLVDNSNDAIFIVQDGVIRFYNPRTEVLIGCDAKELARTSFDALIHPQDRVVFRSKMIDMGVGKFSGRTFSFRILNRQGEILWVHLTTAPTTWEGRPAVIHFLRDISLQKTLELQLQQAQKMEAIGALAGGIAHDFNNILGVIMGYAEMAAIDLPEKGRRRHFLDQVLKAGFRAKDLVKQILAFSRQSEMKKRPLEINPVVKETLKMLRAFLPATIEIRQNLVSNNVIINADPTQIHQVVMNLCTNAHHAMAADGGELDVSLVSVQLGADDAVCRAGLNPGNYIKLTVRDTGTGMDLETRERIFEPYFTTKEKDVGTGMGLAVVHGIVKEYGGAITVESEPGKGTTFDVFFPTAEEPVESEKGKYAPLPRGKEKILLVDDEEPLVGLIVEMLKRLGYAVSSRTSPQEALEAFRAGPARFDLVITDMTMPGMRGDVLAGELMKIRPGVPVILCTGYSDRMTEERARDAGIRDVIMKPVLMRDIAFAIRRVLDQ